MLLINVAVTCWRSSGVHEERRRFADLISCWRTLHYESEFDAKSDSNEFGANPNSDAGWDFESTLSVSCMCTCWQTSSEQLTYIKSTHTNKGAVWHCATFSSRCWMQELGSCVSELGSSDLELRSYARNALHSKSMEHGRNDFME